MPVHTGAQLADSKDKLMEVSQVASHRRGGDMKERTEEDGVRGEASMRRGLLVGEGIKEIFSLIRNP